MVCYRHRHCYCNPMRQSPPHPHISRLFAGYSAGLTDETPSLRCTSDLATVPPPIRRRAPWGHSPDTSPEILPSPRYNRLGALNTPQLPSRERPYRRCSDFVMLWPGRLLAPLGSPVLRRRGLYPRSFHQGGHPTSMSDSLRGCQAVAAASSSPAGLRWLQAALYRRPYGHDTFPALITHPCPGAATHTPGDHLSACTQLLPQPHWPSSA